MIRSDLQSIEVGGIVLHTIGWFGAKLPYNRGCVSDVFLKKLLRLIIASRSVTLSLIHCPFCEKLQNDLRMELKKASKADALNITKSIIERCMPIVESDGQTIHLSRGNFCIADRNGILYWAPKIIYHYCLNHEYSPPNEFVEAVMYAKAPETLEI